MNTQLNADQSAALLAGKIRRQEPFFFLRYGDGALECMSGAEGHTCDGEQYCPLLGLELLNTWRAVYRDRNTFVGDWLSASFDTKTIRARYEEQYRELIGDASPNWLHFEALLLMRQSPALLDFYRAVKLDPRRKLFMGPAGNAGAAKMLGAEFLETPMSNLFTYTAELAKELDREFDVLLFGAGMAGNIPAVRCWERYPERTYISIGSAMDPLFRGRTRMQQLLPNRARMFFRELL